MNLLFVFLVCLYFLQTSRGQQRQGIQIIIYNKYYNNWSRGIRYVILFQCQLCKISAQGFQH